jgi:hypothetical protein
VPTARPHRARVKFDALTQDRVLALGAVPGVRLLKLTRTITGQVFVTADVPDDAMTAVGDLMHECRTPTATVPTPRGPSS